MESVLEKNSLKIGNLSLDSRLILGSGKYKNFELMRECFEAAQTSMVTVAVRRVNLEDKSAASFWSFLPKGIHILPNTAGCYNLEDTLRTSRIARELCQTDLIKLEVLGDPKTLLPDTEVLLQATKILVKEGFVVLPYTNDDPIMARKLVEAGAAAVMPLASPIGSGLGLLNPHNIRLIRDSVSTVPVIVDAGVGTASDAALTMELGVDGILMNTAIAEAENPVEMATAMKLATQAGWLAFHARRMPKRGIASASSPTTGLVNRPSS